MSSGLAPPGPKSHFLIGHLLDFNRDTLGFLTQCARQYFLTQCARQYGGIAYHTAFNFDKPGAVQP